MHIECSYDYMIVQLQNDAKSKAVEQGISSCLRETNQLIKAILNLRGLVNLLLLLKGILSSIYTKTFLPFRLQAYLTVRQEQAKRYPLKSDELHSLRTRFCPENYTSASV
ncbi:hypothetical protein EDC96DRAFT_540085 [Choanephora cucurbitarum]|nr:hypothetical protein EDC96DRAFT_540085 [Choanephora cucurbitarum]